MKRKRKSSNWLSVHPKDEGEGPRRVVWMKPTTFSPACLFVFTPKMAKALSACAMWVAPFDKSRIIEDFHKREDVQCPLCVTGRIASGDLGKESRT